ncbi:chromate efflux transporter [Catellatospora bangladeshensis]|uniref:Chromate transporter n=1 Tax=Catellatospora bangladeshensis TaxID=310355 RepID=A0A8J3JD18_9ACTN|nr:chromate efflux transporter [Catellatospora bangladeshensis]GIF82116.1 chromate transporter [Catellatospora bangladeshensis]
MTDHHDPPRPLREVGSVFLKLGTIGFGGPAAHIAMMREEVVRRRGWTTDAHFLDLVGAVNLIPGPNSTELAIHLGYDRARWKGLVTAGVCFIAPAFLIVLALSWAYDRYGTTPAAANLLYGIKPVVVAIVIWALIGLLRTAVKDIVTATAAVAALAAYLLGVNELAVLAVGGLLVTAARTRSAWWPRGGDGAMSVLPPALLAAPLLPDPTTGQLARLFLAFLKIGSVLYGSGYVLLAFLRGDFVQRLGWLTESQLLDAISIGQVTPGPVFTTATFIGYQIAGLPGAIAATLGVFLPSFLFVALLTRIVVKIRNRAWSAGFLDGVNATALALMAGVTVQLGRTALIDPLTVAVAAVTLILQWRAKSNTAWYIAGGAAIGLAHMVL